MVDLAAPSTDETLEEEPVTSSFPENTMFSISGFESEAEARKVAENLAYVFRELGKIIDLSALDGVTVAWDYDEALASLDRGYGSKFKLERTKDVGIGVAMTPAVLRDGVLKSHILIHGHVASMVLSKDIEEFNMLFHTLAHEAAHVETTDAWKTCFPGELLRTTYASLLDAFRQQVYSACWDEYAATRISNTIGVNPLEGYEATFVTVLSSVQEKVADQVRSFNGGSATATNDFVGSVFGAYGDVMKFACYCLGTLASLDRRGKPGNNVQEALRDSWFEPYYVRLEDACAALFGNFGRWSDKSGFEAIGDILEDIVDRHVMKIRRGEEGRYSIYVHHPSVGP
jgi:hypothetical protein